MFRPGVSVVGEEGAWRKFTATATGELVRLAIAALEVEAGGGV